MMKLPLDKIDNAFQRNLIDWSAGGPMSGGYTRASNLVYIPKIKIERIYGRIFLPVDDVLSKNKIETKKWHISFLYNYLNKGYWKDTDYYSEYLCSRYSESDSYFRAMSFIDLFNNIRQFGVKTPVKVACVPRDIFGFDYFRFDGCHRSCCYKILGIHMIPALLFLTSKSFPTHLDTSKFSPGKSLDVG